MIYINVADVLLTNHNNSAVNIRVIRVSCDMILIPTHLKWS